MVIGVLTATFNLVGGGWESPVLERGLRDRWALLCGNGRVRTQRGPFLSRLAIVWGPIQQLGAVVGGGKRLRGLQAKEALGGEAGHPGPSPVTLGPLRMAGDTPLSEEKNEG